MLKNLDISGDLGWGITGNRLPEISVSTINWTLLLMESSPIIWMRRSLTELVSDKLSNIYIWYPFACVDMYLTTDPENPVTPQSMDHWFSTVCNALNRGSGLWSPATIVRRYLDAIH